jgi:hypothetical protein
MQRARNLSGQWHACVVADGGPCAATQEKAREARGAVVPQDRTRRLTGAVAPRSSRVPVGCL